MEILVPPFLISNSCNGGRRLETRVKKISVDQAKIFLDRLVNGRLHIVYNLQNMMFSMPRRRAGASIQPNKSVKSGDKNAESRKGYGLKARNG